MAAPTPSTQAENNPADVLLVDSRQLVRAGIERVLSDASHLVVSAVAENCNEAIRLARRRQPKLIIINLHGASVEVLDGAGKIRRQFPAIPLLVLADDAHLIIQERLLQVGVAGCVSSLGSVEELFSAIDTVLKGERYISARLARKLAERRLPGHEGSPFDRLTHRELQILLLIAEGRNTLAIAKELGVTRKTVNGYRNRVLEKLHVQTEVELVHLAIRHGLIKVPVID